jgi:hypothetical protein
VGQQSPALPGVGIAIQMQRKPPAEPGLSS